MNARRICFTAPVALVFLTLGVCGSEAQSATLTGIVTDTSKAVLPNATVDVLEVSTQTRQAATTNGSGFYAVANLTPGVYTITVKSAGFETDTRTNVQVSIGAKLSLDFALRVGSQNDTIQVDGSGAEINTTDASVSTLISRNFVENLPLNGRSFQSLITLSPGTEVVPSSGVGSSGEISVNGQRTEANYYTIDGISANTGATVSSSGYPGGGFSGATPQESALGTTQSIISIDALEEFRESTSSYSAEYGRTPGGQFSFSSRAGTNHWHGTAFDYLRNNALDARNFFDTTKLPERQNDFGGTIGGYLKIPHLYEGRDRTFFFFSYEGLRLEQPQASQLYEVPSTSLRTSTLPAVAPLLSFLNAFPEPNGADQGNGLAYYTSGYSAPSSLNTTSIRVDHSFGSRLNVFGRFSDVPSQSESRQPSDIAQLNTTSIDVKAGVVGADLVINSRMADEFRFGYTTNDYGSNRQLTNFGGATPFSIGSVPGLNNGSWLTFFLFYGLYPYYLIEPQANAQHQINVVDSLTQTIGRHNIKYGVDYRHLYTFEGLPPLWEVGFYFDEASVLANKPAGLDIYTQNINMHALSSNFSLFAQDEWKASDRLSLSYGVRWDVNPAPKDANGNTPYTLNQITNLSTATIAPKGTALYQTTYGNFAPRLGVAYQAHRTPGYETVVRAGGGLFYDVGNTLSAEGYYGVGSTGTTNPAGPFPASAAEVSSAAQPNANSPYNAPVFAFDPHLKLPYTGQWNAAVEQGFGAQQTLTLNYVASAGRRLLAQRYYAPQDLTPANPNFSLGQDLYVTTNAASSDYNSLQVKFDRKMSHGLQMLASYTWSHGIDTSSDNFTVYELERGPSDYDIRHNFQLAMTYNVGGHYENGLVSYALTHWSVDARVSARSALPVDVLDAATTATNASTSALTTFHPDRNLGEPLYLYSSNYVGGRIINYNAFTATNGTEGDAGRNSARGFDSVQGDLTLRRDFPIHDAIGLQFRAEAYNILNHAIFGNVYNSLSSGPTLFGAAYNTESSQLGGLSGLYQVGGARSLQVALKLHF